LKAHFGNPAQRLTKKELFAEKPILRFARHIVRGHRYARSSADCEEWELKHNRWCIMRNKSYLNLEGLTERVTPAVSGISFMGGNLTVRLDSQGGALSILGGTATNQNNYLITFNAAKIGNTSGYNVTGSINVISGNGNDTINLEPQAAGRAFVVPGSLNINTGNGDDNISILGDKVAGTAIISGNVTINAGNGADDLSLATGAATDTLTISGRLNYIGGNGLDTLVSNNGNLEINGLTTLNQVNTVTLNPDAAATNTINLVSLQISNPMAESSVNTITLTGDTTTGDTVTINGSFNYTGNMRDDNIVIDGATILGNTLLSLYGADTDNSVTLSSNADTVLQGNLTIIAGNGADTIAATANNTTINGSVTMNLGSGLNSVTLDDGTISGSMTIYGGNGDDTVNIGSTTAFNINGSLTVSLANTASAAGKNELQLTDTIVGGSVTYIGGSGIDSVELVGTSTVANSLSVYMGAGADELSLTDTTVDLGALFADFGVDLIDDTFTNNSAQDFDIQIRNFP
jgi:hypothetical protein